MLKVLRVVTLAAAAALVLPAVAGPSWPPTPPRKPAAKAASVVPVAPAPQTKAINGFEYVGGEAGWQLAQHKYEFVGGKFVMSDECDHAIRIVKAPTPAELDKVRSLQSGG